MVRFRSFCWTLTSFLPSGPGVSITGDGLTGVGEFVAIGERAAVSVTTGVGVFVAGDDVAGDEPGGVCVDAAAGDAAPVG